MLVRGQVTPLPALIYDFSEIGTALRQFSAAKHIGKIVVRVPMSAVDGGSNCDRDNHAAWLVTGGLGALGTLATEWLIGQGRKNIHLLGRSGR